MDSLVSKLSKIGLDESKAQEISKNSKFANLLVELAEDAGFPTDKAAPLQNLALAYKSANELAIKNRKLIAQAVADGRVSSPAQIEAGVKYLSTSESPSVEDLDKECGVGVVISKEDIERAAKQYFAENKEKIVQMRYKALGPTLGAIKRIPELKWANAAFFKPVIDAEMLSLLGPKDERDDPKLQAKKAKAEAKAKANAKSGAGKNSNSKSEKENKANMFEEGFLGALHAAGTNPQANPERMKEHLAFTKGRVFTRFPPEPNGFLHIGHAKAIATNFGYAAYYQGECYLRFDDTNPEAEDEKYSKSIEEIVSWLGFEPYKITWSSDYFNELYELAEKLILKGLAYVCFCTPEQVRAHRGIKEDGLPGGERTACEHRSQTPEKALELFREMRDGKYSKGEATLRMKQDLQNPNPQMWDLVAYRVLNSEHHRTGSQWKIYPTYDFTHCLVDSMENVSHSLCTLEFRMSRESYEWLCDAVDVYRPAQREFGRLNLQGSIMSKRKLLQLVEGNHVCGWDDPRLFTLVALRRRGIPPGAILSFINELGVTTTTTTIESVRFDTSVRKYLEHSVPRLMMVVDPIKVVIKNLPEDYYEEIAIPFMPGKDVGEYKVPFTKTIYIDRSDFVKEADSSFFRLALNQPVGLLRVKNAISAVDAKYDSNSNLVEITAEYDTEGKLGKPKTYIQWVAESTGNGKIQSPVVVDEVREFRQLFKSDNPSGNPNGFLADIDKNSERVFKNAMIDVGFYEVKSRSPWKVEAQTKEERVLEGRDTKGSPESVRFQGLRVGYFCMDKDSTDNKLVLNQIVSLKEDKQKS